MIIVPSHCLPPRPAHTGQHDSNGTDTLLKPLYLARFDDLCPTMNWKIWNAIEPMLIAHRINPIMAVIPDNQDGKLVVSAPREEFWERVRYWQSLGWVIALHGHQHLYVSRERGLVGRRPKSEFAGVSPGEQRRKLLAAAAIMREEGVSPVVWAAPGHTFDAETVKLLPELGIRIISDGYWRWPRRDANDILWVPQQLHTFRDAPPGVWTICHHFNRWDEGDLSRLEQNLRHYRERIASLAEITTLFGNRQGRLWERYLYFGPLNYWLLKAHLALHNDCSPPPPEG